MQAIVGNHLRIIFHFLSFWKYIRYKQIAHPGLCFDNIIEVSYPLLISLPPLYLLPVGVTPKSGMVIKSTLLLSGNED